MNEQLQPSDITQWPQLVLSQHERQGKSFIGKLTEHISYYSIQLGCDKIRLAH